MCPACGRPFAGCVCGRKRPAAEGDGIVRVGRVTKGRKGKGVTVITGIPLDNDELSKIAKGLKQICGSGGTVKKGTIEIQGDHRDMLVEALRQKGYTVRRSGG